MPKVKLVHWFAAADKAPCGATGTLRFTLSASQLTCPRCRKGAGQFFGRSK